jgi:hypothetical protein
MWGRWGKGAQKTNWCCLTAAWMRTRSSFRFGILGKLSSPCKIWGFHGDDYAGNRFLGSCAVYFWLEPTFRRNVSPPSSGQVNAMRIYERVSANRHLQVSIFPTFPTLPQSVTKLTEIWSIIFDSNDLKWPKHQNMHMRFWNFNVRGPL